MEVERERGGEVERERERPSETDREREREREYLLINQLHKERK